jgi:uncharacterized Fe-S cluster-containing radical SAM superfamily enzyme
MPVEYIQFRNKTFDDKFKIMTAYTYALKKPIIIQSEVSYRGLIVDNNGCGCSCRFFLEYPFERGDGQSVQAEHGL